jgi:hypothetical protein
MAGGVSRDGKEFRKNALMTIVDRRVTPSKVVFAVTIDERYAG